LIKNRESAQASRQRKNKYVKELEEKIFKLTDDNSKLNRENVQLKEMNQQLNDNAVQSYNYFSQLGFSFPNGMFNPRGGAIFLILLFSFGVLFNGFWKDDKQMPQSFYNPQSGSRNFVAYSNQKCMKDTLPSNLTSCMKNKNPEDIYTVDSFMNHLENMKKRQNTTKVL